MPANIGMKNIYTYDKISAFTAHLWRLSGSAGFEDTIKTFLL